MSYPSTRSYETFYILKSGISDADAGAIHQKIDNVITKFQGALSGRDDLGLNQLSYPINDDTMGKSFVIQYTGNSGVVEEIERHFKILEDVVRFLTVQVAKDYDYSKVKRQISAGEEEQRRNREFREQRKASRAAQGPY